MRLTPQRSFDGIRIAEWVGRRQKIYNSYFHHIQSSSPTERCSSHRTEFMLHHLQVAKKATNKHWKCLFWQALCIRSPRHVVWELLSLITSLLIFKQRTDLWFLLVANSRMYSNRNDLIGDVIIMRWTWHIGLFRLNESCTFTKPRKNGVKVAKIQFYLDVSKFWVP